MTTATPLSNTDRLIKSFEATTKAGHASMDFMVGKYTGNGTSVVNALRRRGFKVTRNVCPGSYRIEAGAAA
jgi:hypothetical protein